MPTRRERSPELRTLGTVLLFLTALAGPARGESEPARAGPPPPSPAFEPGAGALFADDFTNGNLRGWRADQASVWSVHDGVLRAELPDGKQLHSFLFAGDSGWVDYAVDFDVCGMRGVDKGCAVRVEPGKKGLGVDLRGPGYDDLKLYVNQFPVGSARFVNPNGTWHHVRVEIRGNDRCRVVVDGGVLIDHRLHPPAPPRGGIALSAYTGGAGSCTTWYDNVVVTTLGPAHR